MRFLKLLTLMTLLALGRDSQAQLQVDSVLARIMLADTTAYKRVYFRRPLAWDAQVSNPGNALKVGNVLYFMPCQYGIVFKIWNQGDSLMVTRIDHTRFAGMTGGQYCFYDQQIYSFGGYGFWQTNGQLRTYVTDRAEWEIVKLNEVIPSNNFFTYFDPVNKTLWCAEQDYVNEVLETGEFRRTNDVYRLSPHQRVWEKVGRLNFSHTNTNLHEGVYVETPFGVLVNSGGPKFQIWNFAQNKRYDLGPVSDSIRAFFIPTWERGDHSLLCTGQKILIYDHKRREVFKSFNLDSATLRPLPEKVYTTAGTSWSLWWGLPFLIIPIAVVVYKKSSRGRPVVDGAGGEKTIEPAYRNGSKDTGVRTWQPNLPEPKTAIPRFEDMLTNLEKEILHKIARDTRNGIRTRQEELNRILGTERRNADIQKRHRSDALMSINDKFRKARQTTALLIERARSDEDQRLFEYYINPDAGYNHMD